MNIDARDGLICAGLVRVNPAILDASQPSAVKVDGAFRAFALAQHAGVDDCNDEKNYESKKQPPC